MTPGETSGTTSRGSIAASVVIPTAGARPRLAEVIDALEQQMEAPPFELLLVADGPAERGTPRLDARRIAIPHRWLHCEKGGPARARNAGVRAASGELLLFLGDDTVPARDWVARHCDAHRRRGDAPALAVVGYTRWHRDLRVTPFLAYLNEEGRQFGYGLIEDPEQLSPQMLYASNLSLPRSLLLDEPFDERFRSAHFEDAELGHRLVARRGLRIAFAPEAIVEHDHPTDLAAFARREEAAGVAAILFHELHPELGPALGITADGPVPLPPRLPHLVRTCIAELLAPFPIRAARVWEPVLRYHYLRGLHRGWAQKTAPHATSSEPARAAITVAAR